MRSEPRQQLRDAWRAAPAVDAEARDRLERELLARLPEARPRAWGRRALGIGLAAALALGACALPADYEAPVGHRLAIIADAAILDHVDPHALAAYVTEAHDPDELRISMSVESKRERTGDGSVHEHTEVRIGLDAVGDDIEPEALFAELQQRFPALASATLQDQELLGTVHGTLGGRLSHAWLDLEIDRHGVEEAKARLMEQLRAQGIEGEPRIEITDHDDGEGHRRREVRVEIDEPDDGR